MLGLYPRSWTQNSANNSCVLMEKSGSRKEGRVEIERNRKDVEGMVEIDLRI